MNINDLEKLKVLDPEELQDTLEGEAEQIEIMSYMKPITEDEERQMKDDLTQFCIRKSQYEKELDDIKADYKVKLDPLKKLIAGTLEGLKHRAISVDDDVYLIRDEKNRLMLYVDKSGYLINQRVLSDKELISPGKAKGQVA